MEIIVNEKVIARIQKLLALSESDNPGEAGNAAAKAQELLDNHNLEMSDVMMHGGESHHGVVEDKFAFALNNSATNRSWEYIMGTLARQMYCRFLVHRKWVWGSEAGIHLAKKYQEKRVKVLHFGIVGEPSNVKATVETFRWVRTHLELSAERECTKLRKWQIEEGLKPIDPLSFRINFLNGAQEEIHRIMKARRAESEKATQVTAIVLAHDKRNQEFIEETYGELGDAKDNKPAYRWNGHARNAGKEAGRAAMTTPISQQKALR